jgi:hypothetical protein
MRRMSESVLASLAALLAGWLLRWLHGGRCCGSSLSMRACKEGSFEAAQRGFGEHGTKLAVSCPLSTIPHSRRVERNLGVQRGRPGGAVASTRRPWVLGHGGRIHLSRRGYFGPRRCQVCAAAAGLASSTVTAIGAVVDRGPVVSGGVRFGVRSQPGMCAAIWVQGYAEEVLAPR